MQCLVETARSHDDKPAEDEMGIACVLEGNQRIPESLRALLSIVSLTAANTSRMLEVSVACVKLKNALASFTHSDFRGHSLGIEIQVCTVDLVEPPQ